MKSTKKICPHCKEEFTSNHARRKYCCDAHRVAAYNKRKGYKITVVPPEEDRGLKSPKNDELKPLDKENLEKLKRNDFNVQNIGAVTAGSLIADGVKNMFTSDYNKPASKGFVLELLKEHIEEVTRQNNEIIKALKGLKQSNNYSGMP
jgi:hypothetical protein